MQQQLPYRRQTFDDAYMITTLGEIPDPAAALSEVRRVLKQRGRFVIAEAVVDTGFVLERTRGPGFSYFALFRPVAMAA